MESIQPLETNTIRALGSGQTLIDPISLLKELIENSLDANATQITIEVSPNLLDTLIVKDNGFGISSVDRAVACKPHYTSKITAFLDIIGIKTLGFRGEALASAVEMSEHFSFTTRCEGENVAEVFEIARDGSVKEKRSVGAPLGTTVKVSGFLKRLPVRRENVIRNRGVLVKRLRTLLATYYLSRPRCRFALKILKGGETVVYAPSKTVPEAVKKVVGGVAANAYEWAVKERDGIMVEAFLAKRDCEDVAVLEKSMCDTYIYVDSRPVLCVKKGSTMQKLWKMYKTCVKGIAGDAKAPSNPLLYMNIRCPRGIYDANVEPAKNDVLFDGSKEMDVVSVVEELLKEFYGELAKFQREDATNSRKEKVKEKLSVQDEDFDILLARRKDPVQNKDRAQEMALNLPTPPPPPEEEPDDIGLEPLDEAAIEAEKEQIRKDSRLSNPWTITMMNTPSSPKHRRTAALDSSSPIRPPADTNPSSRPPATTLNITIPSPSRPSSTPVNPLHSFPRTPALKPPRRGFGIPPTPFSPPRSVERQQQRTLLEDPDNAGAMDRFVVRARRSPEPNRRPIPREFEGRPVDPAQIRRAPEREPTPKPIAPRGVEPMRGLESTGTLGPSRGFETIRGLELRGELEPRGGLEPIPKLIPPRGGPPSVEATNTRRTRPRGEEPFNTPRGGFLTAAQVYDEVGSQQFELNDDRDDNHPHKRRRVHANNSPHRNRFLSATAELHDDRPPAESPRSLRPPPPSPLGPPVPPEDESPRRPRPLPPSLLGPPNSKPPLLVPEVGPPNPPPKPGARPTTSHRRRHTTRTLPVPPLFPLDPEWQTHQLVTTMSTLNLEVVPAEDPETLDGGAEFDKDVIGDIVARWLEKLTGVKENVKGWELVEGEEGGRVLKAIHNGEGEGVEVGGK